MTTWFSDTVNANGIKIHYHRTGGDKLPLILSHGFTDTGLCWIRTAQTLEKDYDLIMPDARGHGLTDAPDSGYTVADRADDLAAFIEALELDQPYLMGHSMGADTTAMTAANYPNLAGCAILEDPPWNEQTVSDEVRQTRFKEWKNSIQQRKAQQPEEIIAAGQALNPSWAEIEFAPWAEAKLQVSLKAFDGLRGQRPHWKDILPKISCPTLLITGDPALGALVTPETSQIIGRQWPHINIRCIDGAGHNIRRERFEPFIKVATEFLAELSR